VIQYTKSQYWGWSVHTQSVKVRMSAGIVGTVLHWSLSLWLHWELLFMLQVVCSSCKHVSVTYEPFMYLSVPLPHAMERQICKLNYSTIRKFTISIKEKEFLKISY
jgi:hypothetical protein